ncbi:MAG TPA: type 4a pilus biogenesis protein PilO [Candidatus Margulisiibacteriota bacterium]|nr:type 4a pilus biogenesis protein PilO [Candidatus Margulisiibacteriota bacterium]
MRKIKKREWTLALIFIIIICGLLTEKFIAFSRAGSGKIEEEIAQNEKRLFNLKLILRQTKQLNAEYEKLTARNKGVPYSDNLLQEIEDIARKSNVNILSIKPSVTKEEGALKIYSIKIESQADIATFSRFIYALAEDLKRVGVERVQVNAQKKDEPPRIFLSLNAISFKE